MQFDELLSRCPICTSSDIHFWKSKEAGYSKYSIYTCKNCSGGFLNPRPSDQSLREIYKISGHGLTKHIALNEVLEREKEFPNSTVDAERIVAISKSLCESLSHPKSCNYKLLDIGSGFGFFSVSALRNGFDVTSINPGEYENEVCSELFRFHGKVPNIRVGMFEDFVFDEASFDVVIASQVLEHVKHPRDMVRKIGKILRPGGILSIAVPNFQSLFVKILGLRDQGCLWVPEHCNYFAVKSIVALSTFENGSDFELRKVMNVAKIPYYALSNRLSLGKGTVARNFANNLVRTIQYPICRGMEFFGVGNYLNAFLQRPFEKLC